MHFVVVCHYCNCGPGDDVYAGLRQTRLTGRGVMFSMYPSDSFKND